MSDFVQLSSGSSSSHHQSQSDCLSFLFKNFVQKWGTTIDCDSLYKFLSEIYLERFYSYKKKVLSTKKEEEEEKTIKNQARNEVKQNFNLATRHTMMNYYSLSFLSVL